MIFWSIIIPVIIHFKYSEMIIPNMTRKEITKEIVHDLDVMNSSSTRDRIITAYNRERIKFKINKEDLYPRYFEFKTKTKNNWIAIATKDPLIQKYQSNSNCVLVPFTYYYCKLGINVILPTRDNMYNLYYGHLFERYRTRLGLNMPNLMDVIKLYLSINGDLYSYHMYQDDGSIKTLGIIKEGFIYGEIDVENRWCVQKTFISNKTTHHQTTGDEKVFLDHIKKELVTLDKVKYREYYSILDGVYKTFYPE